ncbi:MAG: UbiA family prenyltransferase [Planctomycetes bacterium]|nr:UbiA family prenyltransferase [Planctomycetota bacterium]
MAWLRLLRPFTLLPPLLGMLSGAASAWGAGVVDARLRTSDLWTLLVAGSLMAVLLNAASNVWNQVCDVELDRVNKPDRPLPRGEVSAVAARWLALALYAASLALAFVATPADVPEVGVIVVFTALLTWAYSGPPLRLRRVWWLAPLVIALPRGGLLKVCGWAVLAPVAADREPWVLGGLFFFFILGCASTKDFSDVEGDRLGGVCTLPIRFGARTAALIMAPFYVAPWVLFAALPHIHVGGRALLSVDATAATILGLALAVHGAVTAWLMVRNASDLAEERRGRFMWRNLYVLMMEAQIGVAVLYLTSG